MRKKRRMMIIFKTIFHILIITMFTLGLSACGYKAPPFYLEEQTQNDTKS